MRMRAAWNRRRAGKRSSALRAARIFPAEKNPKGAVFIDFDATLFEYESGQFPKIGKPIEGAKKAVEWFKEQGHRVVIFSSRAMKSGQIENMKKALDDAGIPYDEIEKKPLAHVYIDDRGVHFDGDWEKAKSEAQKLLSKEARSVPIMRRTAGVEDQFLGTIMDHVVKNMRIDKEALIKDVAEAVAISLKIAPEVSASAVRGGIDNLLESFRLIEDDGIVSMNSELQMVADQIHAVVSEAQAPVNQADLIASLRVRFGTTDQKGIYQALAYAQEDEKRITTRSEGYVTKEEPSQRFKLPNIPGSEDVSTVMENLPTVDIDEEENRLLEQYQTGEITRTDLVEKLKRLKASAGV